MTRLAPGYASLAATLLFAAALLAPLPARATKVPRTVFVEKFGYSTCPYCPPARAALAQLQAELGPERMIYVDYHITAHLGTASSSDRADAYVVRGTPTVFFDGGGRIVGSNPPPLDRYRAALEPALRDSALLSVTASGTLSEPAGGFGALASRASASLLVSADVLIAESLPDHEELFVRALVFEDDVETAAGTFQHAVRAISAPLPLTRFEKGTGESLAFQFPVDPTWEPAHLRIVTWVQRGATMEVLNASQAPVMDPTPTRPTTWGRIKADHR